MKFYVCDFVFARRYPKTCVDIIVYRLYRIECRSYVFVFLDLELEKLEKMTKFSFHCQTSFMSKDFGLGVGFLVGWKREIMVH